MSTSVIHIGANKTASTTLQRALFSQHSGLHYMGEDGNGYDKYSSVVNSMVSDDDLYYPKSRCQDLFRHNLDCARHKTFLYSNEDLMTSRVPTLCAKRLKELVPDAKILLIVRNQNTAIPSFYANHGAFLKQVPKSYFRRHVSFNDWMSFQTMFIKYGGLAGFFYNRLASIYADNFGADQIHILLFEEFLNNKKGFIMNLCEILNIEYNEAEVLLGNSHERQRITSKMLTYNRFRTSFFWNTPFANYIPGGKVISDVFGSFLKSGPGATIETPKEWQERIFDLYAADNKALASNYDLPLEKYNYPVA